MKQSKLFHRVFPFVMMSIPWIYIAFIWDKLPSTIPTHFGIDGTADAYGPKTEIMILPLVFSVIGIGVYFILRNISKIDPKRKYAASTSSVLSKLANAVIIILCAVCLFVSYWTLKGKIESMQAVFCSMGLFFAYIGNLLHSIKPNYFVGFRLPWTLENEENWRKTHQLASKLWFIGGIVLALISLIINLKVLAIIFFAGILIITIIPVAYSYNLYRTSTAGNDNGK